MDTCSSYFTARKLTDVASSLASNRTRCDRRFSVADPSVLTLQCIITSHRL